MFSYIHRYHAGNLADVHKHLVLTAIIQYLKKKPTPFSVFDTHAGEGLYHLDAAEAQKTPEFQHGILPVYETATTNELTQAYLNIVRQYNPDGSLKRYPGSSAIIASLLRESDSSTLIEHHPQAISVLRTHFKSNRQVHIHDQNTFQVLKGLVPPKEKRGLLFIDPSYEVKTEYTDIVALIESVYPKFQNGIYALWYPILPEHGHRNLLAKVNAAGFEQAFCCEWQPYPKVPIGKMFGSGMVVINPPWQLDTQLSDCFAELKEKVFHQSQFQLMSIS